MNLILQAVLNWTWFQSNRKDFSVQLVFFSCLVGICVFILIMSEKSLSASEKITLDFIEDYRKHPELWDTSLNSYTNKTARNVALEELGEKYNLDIHGVKNKIKSLRSYFSREHNKLKTKEQNFESPIISPWFAYKPLSFVLTTRQTREFDETSFISELIEVSYRYSTCQYNRYLYHWYK